MSCASDSIVDSAMNNDAMQAAISFIPAQQNITRATKLQDFQRYNFGVFGYKSTDAANPIIDNYLVGYHDATNKQGYYMTLKTQTTLGDKEEVIDGQSYWAYEHLGNADYTYNGTEGYIQASQTGMMSNEANQYMRYWDLAAPTTTFYAYTPYINGAKTATYNNTSKVLDIPDGALTDGYDHPSDYDYMWAAATVSKGEYGKDVQLLFHRLNAKVNLKFYEELEGYSVSIINLLEGKYNGIQATPAILKGSSYTAGQYYSKTGYSINFSSSVTSPKVTQKVGTTVSNKNPLEFAIPTDAPISTSKESATPSPTTYYALPKDNETGFTFHVSYVLTSTTGEKVVVKDATVFVPADKCNWQPNTAYTYIFKITENTNGSTDPVKDSSIDPTNPKVDPTKALFPIVFDCAQVEDWTPVDYEF